MSVFSRTRRPQDPHGTGRPASFQDAINLLATAAQALKELVTLQRGVGKTEGWFTDGVTAVAVIAAGTKLAQSDELIPGVYEFHLILTNPEAGAFTYDLKLLEGDSVTSNKTQRYAVGAGQTLMTDGYLTVRGRRQKLQLSNVAATTVVGHAASIFLKSVK